MTIKNPWTPRGGKRWKKNGLKIEVSPLATLPTDMWVGRRRQHRLIWDFMVKIESKGMVMKIAVPKGYHTDYATLPLFCQLVLGNRDDYSEAAVAHDWLCTTHVPAFIANQFMRSLMFAYDAPWWKRVAFFYGLMIFGYGSPLSRSIKWLKHFLPSRRPQLLRKKAPPEQ
jgi:hypothetical protein